MDMDLFLPLLEGTRRDVGDASGAVVAQNPTATAI